MNKYARDGSTAGANSLDPVKLGTKGGIGMARRVLRARGAPYVGSDLGRFPYRKKEARSAIEA